MAENSSTAPKFSASNYVKGMFGMGNSNPQSNAIPQNSAVPEERIIKPSEVILEWTAPERIFKTKTRDFYRKIAVIIIFFAILFLFIKEFLLIVVLGVLFFVVYVFHTVPPRDVKHQITTNGINYASEHIYSWAELVSFFMSENDGIKMLNVNTKNSLPGRIFMILSDEVNSTEVSKVVNEYISVVENPEQEPFDKITKSIAKRIKL